MRVSISQLQKGAVQRAKALSIPKRIYIPILRRVSIWVKSSKEEWTTDRLKSIKLDVIRKKAGMPPTSSWIARTRSFHKGEFGSLEKWMSLKDRNFSRGIQLLQVYTLFLSSHSSEKQIEKFTAGVLSTPLSPSLISFGNDIIDQGFDLLTKKRTYSKLPVCQPLVDMQSSPNKRAPLPDGSVPEPEGIVDSLRYLFETIEGVNHYLKYKRSHYLPLMGHLYDVLRNPLSFPDNSQSFKYPVLHGSFLVGKIGEIQEPGFKLRAVANPGRLFQRVLTPLGDAIYDYLQDLDHDCTFNQSKAFPVIQEALLQGKTVHSIDLSGATDYFPLTIQERLLRKIFPEKDVNIFSDLSQASWYFPSLKREISWTRGQPLGLYPSFGAFALTHGVFLLGLLGREFNNEFFVLGDDVVILDDRLASDYNQALSILGCPVAISKSLRSKTLCEFGGKIITKTEIISQYKWRNISDESFLDIARIVGPKSLCLFRPRQVKIIKRFSRIPEFLGGLGWNSEGLPLELRCNDPLIWADKMPVDHLMDYSVVRLRNLFSSKIYQRTMFKNRMGHRSITAFKNRDLEQRSSSLIKKLLPPHLWNMERNLLGKNVEVVSKFLFGKSADLPINIFGGVTLRPSLLQEMEAKVSRIDRQANLL